MSEPTVDDLIRALEYLKSSGDVTGATEVFVSCYETINFIGTKKYIHLDDAAKLIHVGR